MKLFGDECHTHMPFVFEDALLHCRARDAKIPFDVGQGVGVSPYQPYDIYCSDLDGGRVFYIGAELGEDVIACSPNAYRDAHGTVVLNYVAVNMSAPGQLYRHYQRRGPSLRELGPHRVVPEPQNIPTYCQSETRRFSYTVFKSGEWSRLVQYDLATCRRRTWAFENLRVLKRAVPVDESSVVLTYADAEGEKSSLLDTVDTSLFDIRVGGRDVYKSHLHGSVAYFSVRPSTADYGMSIHRDSYSLESSAIAVKPSAWTAM